MPVASIWNTVREVSISDTAIASQRVGPEFKEAPRLGRKTSGYRVFEPSHLLVAQSAC